MYTHKVMCSFMVTKLVKFCQTLFFFLNTMPVALLTSTPGFPAGSFTYNLLSGSKTQRLRHRRRPAWLELLLSLASPGQIGSPLHRTFRASIVSWGGLVTSSWVHPAGNPRGQCGHRWRERGQERFRDPRFPRPVWSQLPGGTWGSRRASRGGSGSTVSNDLPCDLSHGLSEGQPAFSYLFQEAAVAPGLPLGC